MVFGKFGKKEEKGAAKQEDGQEKQKPEETKKEGPFKEARLGYRVLAFMGGLAMIVSNIVNIATRALSLDIPGCVIAVYCIIFGFIIAFLEGPRIFFSRIQHGIRFYAKFLEYMWGRGLLFFFCGVLQIANWSLVDWIVGGFMIFLGVTGCLAGIRAARELRDVKKNIKNEKDLKALWKEHDKNGDGNLNVQELLAFCKAAGVEMTNNEASAAFMALDKNFDEKLTYEEFYDWWSGGNEMRGIFSV